MNCSDGQHSKLKRSSVFRQNSQQMEQVHILATVNTCIRHRPKTETIGRQRSLLMCSSEYLKLAMQYYNYIKEGWCGFMGSEESTN